MAGKDDSRKRSSSSKSPAAFSSPLLKERAKEIGEPSSKGDKTAVCWRKEVDLNLKRLQSLSFGVDHFLEKDDFTSAHVIGLRLLGFLDSRTQSEDDRLFIGPIRHEAASKVHAGLRAMAAESDRRACQLANTVPGPIFGSRGGIEVEKITQSKYFKTQFQQSGGCTDKGAKQVDKKLIQVTSKPMKQTQLTSLYGSNMMRIDGSQKGPVKCRGSGSEDFVGLEKPLKYTSHAKGLKNEVEERGWKNTFGLKRPHMEISSPKEDNNEDTSSEVSGNGFVTAKAKLEMDVRQKRGSVRPSNASVSPQSDNNNRNYGGRLYGIPRRGVRGNFIPPIKSNGSNAGNQTSRNPVKADDSLEESTRTCLELLCGPDGELPEKLRNLEPRLIEHVSNEIMDRDPNVRWNDIAGLEHAKKCVTEMVIWPLLRPDIFKGCRSPGRGLLLFGPPGTGKTMIGKAIAGEAKATFFYISSSSLTSKWIGEGEKLVRALFGVASCRQPAVIFVDEIDSLLSQRKSEGEHESSRRLKTQFLIEMEGFDTGSEQILLIGATNRPQELDEAARRRLTKRLYIPLPSSEARAWIVQNLLQKDGLFVLSKDDLNTICELTHGYSGSDMNNLVKDASMGPLREALQQGTEITKLKKEDMRPVALQDFKDALQDVRPSVSLNELGLYEEWNKQFGSLAL